MSIGQTIIAFCFFYCIIEALLFLIQKSFFQFPVVAMMGFTSIRSYPVIPMINYFKKERKNGNESEKIKDLIHGKTPDILRK